MSSQKHVYISQFLRRKNSVQKTKYHYYYTVKFPEQPKSNLHLRKSRFQSSFSVYVASCTVFYSTAAINPATAMPIPRPFCSTMAAAPVAVEEDEAPEAGLPWLELTALEPDVLDGLADPDAEPDAEPAQVAFSGTCTPRGLQRFLAIWMVSVS